MPTAPNILRDLPFAQQVCRAARGRRLYLVGGAVRCALIGTQTTDLDFLVDDAVSVAARVGRALGGTMVTLHEDLPTARVVVRRGTERFDLDFVTPRAPTLSADLQARDFTMNALAAGPVGGRARLFDPCGGRSDIARGLVRMTSAESLATDPLRVLRAYRFAAQLGFRIEGKTRRACRNLAARLDQPAAERVGAEVVALFAGEFYSDALATMVDDGVLEVLLPEFSATFGVDQGGVHEFDVGRHSLLAARRMAEVMASAPGQFPEYAEAIEQYLADPETRASLVLATLLHDIGKPETRVRGEGRWRFFGHEERGVEIVRAITKRLRLPKRMRRQVELLVGSHMQLLPFMGSDEPTSRARRRFARRNGPHHIGLVLLALADRRSLRSEPELGDEDEVLARMSKVFAAARESTATPSPAVSLLAGRDLVELGYKPGPLFSEILEAVEEAWVEGEVADRSAAVEFVRRRWPPGEL